jgi:hypothetical protein
MGYALKQPLIYRHELSTSAHLELERSLLRNGADPRAPPGSRGSGWAPTTTRLLLRNRAGPHPGLGLRS